MCGVWVAWARPGGGEPVKRLLQKPGIERGWQMVQGWRRKHMLEAGVKDGVKIL